MEDSLVPGANGLPSPSLSLKVDPQTIVDYITNVLQVTLEASIDELEANGSLLSKSKLSDTIQRCKRFALESQEALYVQKNEARLEHSNGNDGTQSVSSEFTYLLSSELSFSTPSLACVAILKRPQPIEPSIPISAQMQIIKLPGLSSFRNTSAAQPPTISPFETIHSVIHLALAPYFDASTRNQDIPNPNGNRVDSETRTGVPGTKKKIAELELSLLHLQQNTEIPTLHLPLHPVVQSALDAAEKQKVKPSLELVPPTMLSDSAFLNKLDTIVNTWIKNIKSITGTTRDPSSGTATQEITFWLSLESALEDVAVQLESEGVQLTLDVLAQAKRFAATARFKSDTGLREAVDTAQKYNQLMREFPLDELLAATSVEKVEHSLNLIFNHLNKKLRICSYPIRRALPLVEAISGDLDTRLHALLHGQSLMHLAYAEFETIIALADGVWRTWDENVKEFTNVARDVTRKRNEKFIPIKIKPRHGKTQDRLKYISNFRTNHEQLQRTIVNVLGPDQRPKQFAGGQSNSTGAFVAMEVGDFDAIEAVSQAYAALRDVDVLDVSPEGTQMWVNAETAYNERTSRVENSIIARLRDRLATARTANEKFRVFSKFNALFIRPKIRGAISEYQTELIENVKDAVSSLHERFKQQYGNSEAHAMALLRDLPPVSGAIIWARQIERQLDIYMKKVEDVLGNEWTLHTEGQKLQNESIMFRQKLDTRPIFQEWAKETLRRDLSITGRLFHITRNRTAGNVLELGVNFDAQVIALFKEVRNLLWLNCQVPHAITNISKEAKRVYPYAVSMMESVHTYVQTTRSINETLASSVLLNGYQNDVQGLIVKGVPLKWESFVHAYDLHVRQAPHSSAADVSGRESKHVQFVRDFSAAVSLLQSKSSILTSIYATVQQAISALETCPYKRECFRQNLDIVQKAVDQLNLENCMNLPLWVADTNAKIDAILLSRLQRATLEWVQAFDSSQKDSPNKTGILKPRDSNGQLANSLPRLEPLVHEVTMRNQFIYLHPPLEHARASWLAHFHDWLGVIYDLQKIQASRYQLRLGAGPDVPALRFLDLANQSTDTLSLVYNAIEDKLSEVNSYVEKWLQFQSLWDLQSEQVYEVLEEDLSMWLQLLQEIRRARGTFDTSETNRSFGNITVDYEQVQMKVNAKYDQWQHEIVNNFAARLGIRMTEGHADIAMARCDLEGQSLEISSTTQAVKFITTVQQCKRKVKAWGPEVEVFRQGQMALSRHRYQFAADWLFVDQVDQEWAALNDVLDRKSKVLHDQMAALRTKISAEDKVIMQKIADIAAQWNEEKPVSGTTPANEASLTLSAFDSRLTQLQQQAEMVDRAKDALDLPASIETVLPTLLEEVQDFKSVWAALSTIWNSVNELRDSLWTSIQPRKLRQSLEALLKTTKEMPSRMRQYAAFEHVQSVLRLCLKVNPLLSDMRSEAVRERHWVRIFKALKPSKRFSPLSMTLGDVWDLQLGPSESVIRDIVTQAQGEMALEEFLRQVRETWQNYSLDLVNYQKKCRLIRGWDELFAKCSENLNSLQAMRHSPYYKEFEEEASSWEEKLNRVHVLFDVWIDVQRQWVYLEGVFTGNADIRHLLPTESARFNNINAEFFTVMKKVYKSPFVLDVLGIVEVQKSLERLAELLKKIQKALGEYLEKERVTFPRFYFVSDEDLLEIIGNSNDTARIAKHLGKMFAGVSALLTNEESTIVGFASKEGEHVMLKREISLIKTPKVNEWLAALENNMRTTLAELLSEAIDHFVKVMSPEHVDVKALDAYLVAYPAQIVLLATQVCWTSSVERSLAAEGSSLAALHDKYVGLLGQLAALVLKDLDLLRRKKCEHLITEFVHQRDIIRHLIEQGARSASHYQWLLQMRYVYVPEGDHATRLQIKMANATLDYGFEYIGVVERLVRTPLTDRCFLTLTQALCQRLGGSPYGPAGTGKTESVKALGMELGRFTLVFCCDDTFDFQAMGRIFLGICQVGAWGCFDEFNRLEERILSAVSQQVQNIQLGLRNSASNGKMQIELVGRHLKVNTNTGIFITMNPGYAGRSNLPDNLKKLFRSVAMSRPDKELIAEVMLYSQGFSGAKQLAKKIVPFFDECSRALSQQAHYDFGLRALKSVLTSSGGLKRARLSPATVQSSVEETIESQIIVQSVRETIAPKLVRDDVVVMERIEALSFPDTKYVPAALDDLKQSICDTALESKLVVSDAWLTKILQLYQIQVLQHGVMMVGDSGSGKSAAWRVLLQALQRVEGVEGVCHVIDPKVMSKECLYGSLDSTTREWTDGLFTSILRKIVDNLRGEETKRHWIVFDGDVDPEWVENLNSVLDDNKLLTLPNGERLSLPPNVRIMFEVETLKYATLATVSRCGMVWFSRDIITTDMTIAKYLGHLRTMPFEGLDDD
ncbi:Dynein heavy chain, cytoplasmic, partial [Cryomyces minteri]